MTENQIAKEKAYATLGKHICGELIEEGEDAWVVYPPSTDRIVASRKIVISKKTGEIITDIMEGE